jgi:hypothetical protein
MKKMLCCGPLRPLPRLIRPVLGRISGMRLKLEARLKLSIKQTISKEEQMRTTYFARVRSAAVAAFAVALIGTGFANAQSGAPVRKDKAPNVTILGNRVLQRSAFETSNSNVTTTCSTSGCGTSTAVFLKNIVCPQPGGKTCTLYVHLESQDEVTANDNGLFKFLVDGRPPSPGPTDGTGLFRWVLNDPDSGNIEFEARSFAVVATVRNGFTNQNHSVEVDIACEDITGDGCTAAMGLASLNIGVYTP